MDRIRIEDVDSEVDSASVKRSLTDALSLSNLAVNYYELAPGDSFAYGYHSHETQEEVFLVLDGTVTFETEAGEVVVAGGEAVRVAPGEFQQGVNTGTDRVRAFALGAPREGGETEILRECRPCGKRTPQSIDVVVDGRAKETRCLECGTVTARFE